MQAINVEQGISSEIQGIYGQIIRGSAAKDIGSTSLHKILMLGVSGVGKSQIANRLCKESFDPDSQPTVGLDFGVCQTEINEKFPKLQLWDAAGRKEFASVTKIFY